jgi:hypothetical protein
LASSNPKPREAPVMSQTFGEDILIYWFERIVGKGKYLDKKMVERG